MFLYACAITTISVHLEAAYKATNIKNDVQGGIHVLLIIEERNHKQFASFLLIVDCLSTMICVYISCGCIQYCFIYNKAIMLKNQQNACH